MTGDQRLTWDYILEVLGVMERHGIWHRAALDLCTVRRTWRVPR
jgi:hypothetical protein